MPRFVGYAVVALLLAAGGYALLKGPDPASVPSSPTTGIAPRGLSADEVFSATAGAGLARVQVTARAHMPSGFDDGVPGRSFRGRGIVDQGREIAGVYFSLGKVPNAAGFFGHVDPTLSVVYAGPRFVVSFPQLAELLADPVDWISYELGDLSEPNTLRLGIGQLREIGLSDPRLATAVLDGLIGDLQIRQPSPGTDPSLTIYGGTVDVAAAAEASPETMGALFDELTQLGVTSFGVEIGIDAEERIGRFAYSLSYPPAAGSELVQLDVEMTFPTYGVQRGLHPPREETVMTFDEYLAQ